MLEIKTVDFEKVCYRVFVILNLLIFAFIVCGFIYGIVNIIKISL